MNTLRSLRHNWDAVTNSWNQWVLNYTPDRQRSFIQSLGFDDVDWRTLIGLMIGAGMIVVMAIALPLTRNRQQLKPVDKLYLALCRHMARRGCAPAIHEGPRAYAARLTSESSPLNPAQKTAVGRFLELYESIRYGAPDNGKNTQKTASADVSRLKSLLAECK